jgi:hypothetical protein
MHVAVQAKKFEIVKFLVEEAGLKGIPKLLPQLWFPEI